MYVCALMTILCGFYSFLQLVCNINLHYLYFTYFLCKSIDKLVECYALASDKLKFLETAKLDYNDQFAHVSALNVKTAQNPPFRIDFVYPVECNY